MYECRFDYRTQRQYEVGDNKERTCGAPRADRFGLVFDKNCQIKPVPIQNNGRQVPYVYGSTVFGANNDTQFILMPSQYNSVSDTILQLQQALPPLTRVQIEEISNLLCAAKCSGPDLN